MILAKANTFLENCKTFLTLTLEIKSEYIVENNIYHLAIFQMYLLLLILFTIDDILRELELPQNWTGQNYFNLKKFDFLKLKTSIKRKKV